MKTVTLSLLTIIADDALRALIEADIMQAGATGFTVSHAEGRGSSGDRNSAWVGENIRFDVLGEAALIHAILEVIATKYFDHYAVIAYTHEVQVLRPAHFRN
jgi:nitrogen regulatory protein P-II 2